MNAGLESLQQVGNGGWFGFGWCQGDLIAFDLGVDCIKQSLAVLESR